MDIDYPTRLLMAVALSVGVAAVLLLGVSALVRNGYVGIGIGLVCVAAFVLAMASSAALKAAGHSRGTGLVVWYIRRSENPLFSAYLAWLASVVLLVGGLLLSSGLPGTPPDPGHHGLEVSASFSAGYAVLGALLYHWGKRVGER